MEKDLSKARSALPGAPESAVAREGRVMASRDQDRAEGIEGKQMLRGCSALAV